MLYRPIDCCRVCKHTGLTRVLDLGDMALTGVFPSPDEAVPTTPLRLVRCLKCHASQLAHNYDLATLYGPTYGYRSSLNSSMVAHLREKARLLSKRCALDPYDVVVDIGSNDGTFLSNFPDNDSFGVDPLSHRMDDRYPARCKRVAEFFDGERLAHLMGKRKARLVTTIAMFYDLPDPVLFARDVASILSDEGTWHIEVAYWPELVRLNAFDGICQEHLLYYSLTSLNEVVRRAGLYIHRIEFNNTNGASIAVDVKKSVPLTRPPKLLEVLLAERDHNRGWNEEALAACLPLIGNELRERINEIHRDGGLVLGLGASTKGNVLLQHFHLHLLAISDVNPDKYGKVTPGTHIPIVNEAEAAALKPTHYLVLPWHFRSNLIGRMASFLTNGGSLLFPLPAVEVVTNALQER
jgi:hypothetical protein